MKRDVTWEEMQSYCARRFDVAVTMLQAIGLSHVRAKSYLYDCRIKSKMRDMGCFEGTNADDEDGPRYFVLMHWPWPAGLPILSEEMRYLEKKLHVMANTSGGCRKQAEHTARSKIGKTLLKISPIDKTAHRVAAMEK